MSSIDERIVDMKFNNKQFESGVKTTQGSLASLEKSLQMTGSMKGFTGLGAGIDALVSKFNALSIVGITALTNIANRAVNAGVQLVKSLTIDPIKAGFDEYELKLGSIQTILANTERHGTTLATVTSELNKLNEYSDKTIYNFGQMTKNVGLFTNAGIKVEDATQMIKGFSNAAAASGTSAEGAASAAYQLSQALSAGKITLMDWRSLQNVGMGNKNMQTGILEIAKAMGTLETHGVKATDIQKDFNGSLEKGWLTADVMSFFLKTMAQDNEKLNRAQLASIGITGKQADAFIKQQKTAQEAATKVRTFTQLLGTLREAVGSGWSQTFETVFGNFTEATDLFTGINDAIGGFIQHSSEARNKVLADWKTLGGRTALLEGIKNVFEAIGAIIKPIKDAFRDIFPARTGQQLADITKNFRDFTEKLKIGAETGGAIKQIFTAIFSVFKIVGQVVSGVVRLFTTTLGLMSGMGAAGTGLIGSIAGIVTKFTQWVLEGDKIKKFFDFLIASREKVFGPIYNFVAKLIDAFSALVTGGFGAFVTGLGTAFGAIGPIIDALVDKFNGVVDTVKKFLGIGVELPKLTIGFDGLGVSADKLAGVGENVNSAWESVKNTFGNALQGVRNFFSGIGEGAGGAGQGIVDIFSVIKDKVVNFVKGMGINEALALVNTGFFIALYRMFKGFTKSLKDVADNFNEVLQSASGVLDQVTDNLKTMQNSVRAQMIMQIAIAIGVLAASLFVLSRIDPARLAISLGAVAILMGILIFAMKQLDTEITKGAGKSALVGAARMTIVSAALVGLGIALLAMAAAVAIFGNMDLATLAKGIGAVAVTLGIMIGAVKLLDKAGGAGELIKLSIAIAGLSIALTLFAGAVKLFAQIDTQTLIDGGWKIVAVMATLILFMKALPSDSLAKAGSILIIAGALTLLAGVLKVFSMMDIGDLIQSMITLGAALAILTVAVKAMEGSLRGAAAMILVAAALNILVPVLVTLGSMDMTTLAIGLGAIAVALGILLAAGALAAIVAPGLMVLGQAILLLGIAALAAGAGMFLFATGIAALAAAGAAGTAALVATIIAVANLFPLIMQQFGLGVIAFAKVISESGPILVAAFSTVLKAMLQAIIDNIPKVRELLMKLIAAAIDVLQDAAPRLATAGINIVLKILEGMRGKIGKIIDVATDLIVEFISGVQKNYNKLINASAEAILKFITELTKSIDRYSGQLGEAGGKLLVAIMRGFANGIGAAASQMWDYARQLASNFLNSIKSFLGIASPSKEARKLGSFGGEGFILGVRDQIPNAGAAGRDIGDETLTELQRALTKVPNLVGKELSGDFSPRITPVIDLSQVRRQIPELSATFNKGQFSVRPAFQTVSAISAQAIEGAPTDNFQVRTRPAGGVTFIQNNTSPKALSAATIYRQTNNQLSTARGALTTNA